MSTIQLVRERIPQIEDHIFQDDLADRAAKLLGYERLRDEDSSKGIDIMSVLSELDIAPFEFRSVQKYKIQKAKSIGIYNKRFLQAIEALGVALVGVAIFSILTTLTAMTSDGVSWTVISVPFMIAVLSMVIATTLARGINEDKRKIGKWKLVPLKGATERVPEFALETACQIKERIPSAEFYLDTLVCEEVQYDPFLVLRLNNTDYYLEVWDEPGFKQEREF